MLDKSNIIEMIKNDESLSSILRDERGIDIVTTIIMESKEQDSSIDSYFYDMAENFIKVMLYYIESLENENDKKLSTCLKIIKENENSNKQNLKELLKKNLSFENKGRMLCDSVFLNPDQSLDTIMKISVEKLENILY